jgi:hypothetical protein
MGLADSSGVDVHRAQNGLELVNDDYRGPRTSVITRCGSSPTCRGTTTSQNQASQDEQKPAGLPERRIIPSLSYESAGRMFTGFALVKALAFCGVSLDNSARQDRPLQVISIIFTLNR